MRLSDERLLELATGKMPWSAEVICMAEELISARAELAACQERTLSESERAEIGNEIHHLKMCLAYFDRPVFWKLTADGFRRTIRRLESLMKGE